MVLTVVVTGKLLYIRYDKRLEQSRSLSLSKFVDCSACRRQQETRLVAQLLTLMDGVRSSRGPFSSTSRVVVVAATNR